MEKKKDNKENKDSNLKWLITVSISSFILSLLFSYISTTAISDLPIIPSVIILLVVIFLGILFDLIATSVTIANEEDFHARASKKIKGSKTAIKLIRNSAKVANFCADVIGDISGVLSGAISAMLALKLMENLNLGSYVQFILSALVSSLIIGGKAITKEFAKNNSTKIIAAVTKIINFDK